MNSGFRSQCIPHFRLLTEDQVKEIHRATLELLETSGVRVLSDEGVRLLREAGCRVQGNTVRAKNVGRDIFASLKNIVGGELTAYTELLVESRRQAMERMMAQAQQLGANAVVNVRFSTSSIAAGASELYVYGTAVVIQPAV